MAAAGALQTSNIGLNRPCILLIGDRYMILLLLLFFLVSSSLKYSNPLMDHINIIHICVIYYIYIYILYFVVIAGMERFAFKGVASNMVAYLTDVAKMSNSAAAAKTVNMWCGLTSIMPMVAAPLADYYFWDRYSTILAFSILYLAGLVALTSTTVDWARKGTSSSMVFLCLCLISVGQGGYNPSLQAFGADQLGEQQDLPCTVKDGQAQSRSRGLFFTRWYFGVCTGSLLGISIMSFIQDNWGWGLGFAVPSFVMAISVILFSSGSSFYMYTEPGEVDHNLNLLHRTAQALTAAVTKTFRFRIANSNSQIQNKIYAAELELHEKSKLNLSNMEEFEENPKCLMEKVRVVLHLFPIWATLLIFAVIFQQPPTFFTKQGMAMKRNIGSSFRVPSATLQSAITISIILLMPLYDKHLVPLMKAIKQDEKGITVTQRIGFGMFLSTIAMVVAAVVEGKRLVNSRKIGSETEALSIFWLLPQYILLGISDIFTVVGMQEFFYGEVPANMRTMGIALNTGVFGVGSFVSALLISLVELFTGSSLSPGKHGWFSDDMREARLDKYYWLLAGLSALSFLLYSTLCRYYRSINSSTKSCK
ncbi:hypothetical protein Dimus_011307 [Dionaea muscipula]